MLVLYGNARYGRVDIVPGFFRVETQFLFWMFIPVIPIGTYLVADGRRLPFKEAQIPTSIKSILAAWVRAGCILSGLAGMGWVIMNVESILMTALLFAACVGGMALLISLTCSRAIMLASCDRALNLAHMARLPEESIAELRSHFGLIQEYTATHGFLVEPTQPK